MRWLAHRGGAAGFSRPIAKISRRTFPVAGVIGADPATILGAVTPCAIACRNTSSPDCCAGSKTELVKCLGSDLQVPAFAEIVLEGVIHPEEVALEGPYGDHTGYYNEQDKFPVFTIERITMRRDPVYHSLTPASRPTSGDAGAWRSTSVRAAAAKAVPENRDFYLPPKAAAIAWRS